MCKVDEKWLKENGWTCWVDKTTESWDYNTKTITHHTVYVKTVGNVNNKKYKRARWEHKYRRSFIVNKKSGNEYPNGVSNFYMFGAFGDGFYVDNKISHYKFESEKIEAACTLCGIK